MNVNEALDLLREAFRHERLAHAYVVVGDPRGGARELAVKLAQFLLCESGAKPCGTCRSCRQAAARQHADVMWIEPQKKSRIMGIDAVREAVARVQQTSFCGGWKVCILVSADRMGPDGANALLKTLEEPPGKTMFLLLTDSPQFLLPTILSRCQTITVSGLSEGLAPEWRDELLGALTDTADDTGLGRMMRFARVRSLVKQMQEVAKAIEKEAMSADETNGKDEGEILDARASARYRGMRNDLMRSLLHWYRDLLLLVCRADSALVHHGDRIDDLNRSSRGVTARRALDNVRMVEWMTRQMDMNLPDDLIFQHGLEYLT